MSSLLNIKSELTVVYHVKDYKAAAAWYKKYLGFEIAYEMADIGWCELKSSINGVYIGLSQNETPQVEGGATLTWGTSDIEADNEVFKRDGIKTDGDIYTIPDMVRLLTFYDPDGNHLMLAQSLMQQS